MRARVKMTEREKAEGRLAAAKARGGARAATPIADVPYPAYTVAGSKGDTYRVDMIALDLIVCTCEAGKNRIACWHGAAAWMRTIADRSVAR